MKPITKIIFLLPLSLLIACQATTEEEPTINIKNEGAAVSGKGIELPIGERADDFILQLSDAEIPYQTDDVDGDGQADVLFFQVDLPAESTVKISEQEGSPKSMEAKTQAILLRQPHDYDPEDVKKITGEYLPMNSYEVPANLKPQNYWVMFEGPTWENDKIAYRFYLDSRNRYDIFGKQINDLVMDTVGWNYHDIHSWGSDILKVNSSLGIGSPAILLNDSLYAFEKYEKKTVEIVSSGPLRSIIRTNFMGLQIAEERLDLSVTLEIQAGLYQTKVTVDILKSTLENPIIASGVVDHGVGVEKGMHAGHPWVASFGAQSFHKEKLGMAVFSDKKFQGEVLDAPTLQSHAMKMIPINNKVEYSLIAVWERSPDPVQNMQEFLAIVQSEIDNLYTPINIQ